MRGAGPVGHARPAIGRANGLAAPPAPKALDRHAHFARIAVGIRCIGAACLGSSGNATSKDAEMPPRASDVGEATAVGAPPALAFADIVSIEIVTTALPAGAVRHQAILIRGAAVTAVEALFAPVSIGVNADLVVLALIVCGTPALDKGHAASRSTDHALRIDAGWTLNTAAEGITARNRCRVRAIAWYRQEASL